MIDIDIPGHGRLVIEHLVLDVNGTIAEGGALVAGVAEAVEALSAGLHVVAVTADAYGTATRLRATLGIDIHILEPGREAAQKLAYVRELGADRVAAIGNGANDSEMLSASALGIAVIGAEGATRGALDSADIVVTSVMHALALIAQPARIAATLRR